MRASVRLVLLACLLATPFTAVAQQNDGCPEKNVIFVPTPMEVVNEMLKLAGVTSTDVVYDLGSGDGRIPIAAARTYGARGVGIDICELRIREANAALKAANLGGKVRFLKQDLFKADIREATVVTMYLLPALNVELILKLNRELKPGTRVVSHVFDMSDDGVQRPPKAMRSVNGRTIYLWTTPILPEPGKAPRR